MVVYRVFCTKDKSMQDRIREVIIRNFDNLCYCNSEDNKVKSNYHRNKDLYFN